MPRTRSPEKFPAIYYDLFKKVLEAGQHEITGLTRKQAHSMRFQLNSFRRSLQVHLSDIALQYEPITISLRHDTQPGVAYANEDLDTNHVVVLTLANQTPEAELIAQSLGLDALVQNAKPPAELEEPLATAMTSATPHFDSTLAGVLGQMRGTGGSEDSNDN